MLSKRAKYGLHAMFEIARLAPGESLRATQLSERIKAPLHFLEAILLDLRKDGWLQSKRGRAGGYALAKPADMIAVADIIRLIDGPLALTTCSSRNFYARCDDCPTPDDCQLRLILLVARDAVARVLEEATLVRQAKTQSQIDVLIGQNEGGLKPLVAAMIKSAWNVEKANSCQP